MIPKYHIEWKWHLGNGVYNADNDTEEGVEPIPLTPEILEKAGFEEFPDSSGLYGYEAFTKGNCYVEISPTRGIGVSIGSMETAQSIKYLHQLQNLYFALTGEELNIKL